MSLFLHQVAAILWKDLKTEIRTKERLSAMCFFAFLVVLIFNFALEPGSAVMASAAPGIFWIAVTFAGLLGLTRSFTMEQENDCLMGLLLSPADRGAIYLGKTLANLLTMAFMEALLLPQSRVGLRPTSTTPGAGEWPYWSPAGSRQAGIRWYGRQVRYRAGSIWRAWWPNRRAAAGSKRCGRCCCCGSMT